MDKVKGLEVLIDVVKENKRHQDYERVENLADKYFRLVTAEGIEKLLQQIITRETDEEFAQRTKITKSICPAILNSTKISFQKAARKTPDVREIKFKDDSENKKSELEQYISTYWGTKSLEKFLEYAFIDYSYVDPNAFLITEFDAFNSKIEKAKPYPFIATAEEAIMFEYKNEILEYLVVRLPIKYIDLGSPQDGFKYTMYLGMDTIELKQISEADFRTKQFDESVEVIEIEKKFYTIEYFQPKNEKVPAMRFGFKKDEVTKGRTYVSVFHKVLCYLEKTLKIDSELDLSTSMCAFQQRFAYVSPCQNKGCSKGVLLDGSGMCTVCNGTGKQPFHRGTMDIITLELPRDPNEIIDLERLQVTKGPLIELLDFQKEYIEYLIQCFHKFMFTTNIATRSEVATAITATEANFGENSMNDALYEFTQHYSTLWEFVVKDIATFTDMSKGMEVQYLFPFDLKMQGIIQLAAELKSLKDAAASTSTIAAVEDDMNEILYNDRPNDLKEIKIKNLINPFRGYSETDIRFIISQNNVPLYYRTLWENFEAIFQELESEYQNPWFFDLEYNQILKLVRIKTQEFMKIIESETPEPVTPAFGGPPQ